MPGEVRLAVSTSCGAATPDRAMPSMRPAVELFTARARAARPGFELTDEDAWLAVEISRLVDGLPLAIELAAARVNVLGLAEILALVRRRLELLHDRPASDASRAALGTLVEWSYDLLHADEKTLLHHVAVHRGGAPLRALVEAGADHGLDEMTVVELLGTLVDKSIVTVSFPSADARYDVLDTVRDYALERLAEGGGLVAARRGARGVLRHVGGRRARRPSWTRVASMGRTPRAGARQPVGRPHVRAGSVRRRHRGPVGNARLVLHAGGARFRRAAASSSSRSLPRPRMLPPRSDSSSRRSCASSRRRSSIWTRRSRSANARSSRPSRYRRRRLSSRRRSRSPRRSR